MKVDFNKLQELRKTLTIEENQIIERIHKKDGQFRLSKPKVDRNDPISGKSAYVWRMIAFRLSNKSQHRCLPICADFDLPYNEDRSIRQKMIQDLEILIDKILNCEKPPLELNGDLVVCNIDERSSLLGIAANSNTKKVNQLDYLELIAVLVCVKTNPFPCGQGSKQYQIIFEALKNNPETIYPNGIPSVNLGDLRLAIVKSAGSGFNAPHDSYLNEAIEYKNTKISDLQNPA